MKENIITINFTFQRLPDGDIDQNTLEAALMHRSFDAMTAVLWWIFGLIKQEYRDFSLCDSRALEIGTGKFLNHALALYICGCSEVISIDKYRQLIPEAVSVAMSQPMLARRFLSGQVEHDDYVRRFKQIRHTDYDLVKLKELGIVCKAPLELDDSEQFQHRFDFVFSYTVSEHVTTVEIKPFLDRLFSALKPGAFCAHFVDLEDHLNAEKNPFGFLSSEVKWRAEDAYHRGSRMRFSTWKKRFGAYEDVECRFPYIAVRNDPAMPELVDPEIQYLDEQDLRTTAFLMVGKRNK